MKINYDKNDLLVLGMDDERANDFAKVFCRKKSDFPMKYLGVSLHFSKLRREDLQPVVDKIVKRIVGWKGRLLSYAGRLTLLKSRLVNIPIYLLSIIKFPRWVIDMLNTHMGHFFGTILRIGTNITWPIGNLLLRKRNWGVWGSLI